MTIAHHEPYAELSPQGRNVHRALTSLVEELEAVDWYNQRVDVTDDAELKAVLAHNRDEEMEHAAMALEWLRRVMPRFDEALKTYLFTSGSITQVEEERKGSDEGQTEPAGEPDLGIGTLRKGD